MVTGRSAYVDSTAAFGALPAARCPALPPPAQTLRSGLALHELRQFVQSKVESLDGGLEKLAKCAANHEAGSTKQTAAETAQQQRRGLATAGCQAPS